ncbi:sensor histidine kinase [Paenibacillus sp. J2TS4]|uniref:sensor histidine kinase n=1 Tax=Paenibacillus sp. J2TS4 TaxID=2807194 RepID=UPI001B05A366|nr:histidine kinase [Paenibacillus sp. J2TS4]GIP33549.1 histidine kinase [Paenibacillus sp. J2TS4]
MRIGHRLMRIAGLRSLKHRLTLLLLLSTIIPLAFIGPISYYSMYSILKNKAETGVINNLHQMRTSLENTLNQLNHVSQQLTFDGRVGKNIERYINASHYEKRALHEEISNQINLVQFTNPSIGLMFYFFQSTDTKLFETFSVRDDFNIDHLSVMMEFKTMTYFNPHPSVSTLNNNDVLSILRQVRLPERDDLFLYIETDPKLLDEILNPNEGNFATLLVDNRNRIAYSQHTAEFPIGSLFEQGIKGEASQDNYFFEEKSNQGWKVVAVISKSAYNNEIHQWVRHYILFAILSIALGLSLAWLIWRTVYRPLMLLSRDIRHFKDNHEYTRLLKPTASMIEFEQLQGEFRSMSQRIGELITEVAANEQRKAQLEVEKLMHQINPHFLYNSLDTVRWLARANGQQDIDRLVSTLTKVLYYNLGKQEVSTIKEEMDALQNYVTLQGIRYNFQFNVQMYAEPDALDLPIPRFILQPLVENSLYHGLNEENGRIEVNISKQGDTHVVLRVCDNGSGMTEEQIRKLLDGEDGKQAGMGIGLRYVHRIMKFKYGERANLDIRSQVGKGTCIALTLPIASGEERSE